MSPFDKTWQFKFNNRYWNFGYLKQGKVEMPGWVRVWKFYIGRPVLIKQ